MKILTFAGLAVAFGLVVPAVPVFAHHSFAAEFDGKKQVTLTGVVTKVDWVNPHAYIYVDVKGEDGTVVNWAIETGAPNALYRQGWRKADLKAGDMVTLDAFLAKDGRIPLRRATSSCRTGERSSPVLPIARRIKSKPCGIGANSGADRKVRNCCCLQQSPLHPQAGFPVPRVAVGTRRCRR